MAFLTVAPRVTAAVALVAAVGVCPLAAQTPGASGEDAVKAAYVFNFVKFVQWPSSAFTGTTDPLNVCALGDTGIQTALERILAGELVDGRPLKLVSQPPDGAAGCHVLFVGRGDWDRGMRLVAAAANAPVLTVGDSPRFLHHGGMISFVVEARRMRFDINLPAADQAGLKLSSKLLRVARHVRREQGSP